MSKNNTENTPPESKKEKFDKIPEQKVEPENGKKKRKYKKKADDNNYYNYVVSVINYLNNNYEFRYNVVLTEYEYIDKNSGSDKFHFFDDRAYNAILADLLLTGGLAVKQDLYKTLIYGELSPNYNPFVDYLQNLDKWSRGDSDYISDFLQVMKLGDDNKRTFLNFAFKKWFVSYVRALWDDQAFNHQCLVLTGGQGKGKSTFLMSLVPEDLRYNYVYLGNFNTSNKDHELKLATTMMILLEELSVLNKNELESVKATITQPYVKLRKAYGRADTKAPRRSSFAGTTNKKEILRDLTGNRRWLVFEIDDIYLDKLKEFDINKIYSQAYYLSKPGNFEYWFDKADNKIINEFNEEFREKSFIEELLILHFRKPSKEEAERKDYEIMLPAEILAYLNDKYPKMNMNDSYKNIIGQVLSHYGFEKKSKKCHGESVKGWIVQTISTVGPLNEWKIEDGQEKFDI